MTLKTAPAVWRGVALARGKIMRPADLGLVASLGIAEVVVRRRLRVALALRERLNSEPYYRVVFGESDQLPGLVLDRYDVSVTHDQKLGEHTKLKTLVYAYRTDRIWRRQEYTRAASPDTEYSFIVGDVKRVLHKLVPEVGECHDPLPSGRVIRGFGQPVFCAIPMRS